MKEKYRLFIIFILLSCIFTLLITSAQRKEQKNELDVLAKYLDDEEIAFAMANNYRYQELQDYLEYDNFNIFNFRSYLRLRTDYQLSPLGAINFYHNPSYYAFYQDPKPALFLETPLVLVNKCYYLDKEFVPSDLELINEYDIPHFDREGDEIRLKIKVMNQLKLMIEESKTSDHSLVVYSGYRSYQKQEYLYYEVYNKNDNISARPGFSEHQTGYAVDISTAAAGLSSHFEKTLAYEWLIENSHRFGFILRFPKGKEDITGYQYEPWHFRYVGEHAKAIYQGQLTLEEYILGNFQI